MKEILHGHEKLEKLKNLQSLDLSETAVSNEIVNTIKSLNNLRDLDIEKTRITDKGMAQLKDMKNLQLRFSPADDVEKKRAMTSFVLFPVISVVIYIFIGLILYRKWSALKRMRWKMPIVLLSLFLLLAVIPFAVSLCTQILSYPLSNIPAPTEGVIEPAFKLTHFSFGLAFAGLGQAVTWGLGVVLVAIWVTVAVIRRWWMFVIGEVITFAVCCLPPVFLMLGIIPNVMP